MTTDDKTPDPTPAFLPPARLAEIRERVAFTQADGEPGSAVDDRRALLAHLDALTSRAPVDGEALGRGLYERGRSISMSGAQVVPWKCLTDDMKSEHIENALALHAIGHAAGRSEGEAERVRLADDVDVLRAQIAGTMTGARQVVDDRDAEIASLTAERDAMAAELARWCKSAGVTSPEALASLLRDNLRAMDTARRDGAREEREACANYLANNGDGPGAMKLRNLTAREERARGEEQGS